MIFKKGLKGAPRCVAVKTSSTTSPLQATDATCTCTTTECTIDGAR
ncbi:MAG: hypothetical protein IJ752_03150 [Alphaproteobacteria bacterium]|nr:hypothetical protein [Alphaproteobacteria bacterium]